MFHSVAFRFVATATLVLAAALGPASAGQPAAPEPGQRNLLILGDSLSAEYGIGRGTGWVSLLSRRLADQGRPYVLVNASISGETTAGGRTRLPELLAKHRPAIVVIELGANDALRGLPLGETESNLRAMVVAAREAGARPLVVGMMIPPNYGRAYADRFAAIFRRVADSEGARLVPFLLEGLADRTEFFLPDRIHPAEAAQPKIMENVWPVLETMLRAPAPASAPARS
jgi:acyl-CoA thioesterase I